MTKHKTPSDEMTSLAGRVLGSGNPLENECVMAAIAREMGRNGLLRSIVQSESITPEAMPLLRDAVRTVLAPYFDNAESLAGAVMSLDPQKGPNVG